MCVCGGGGGGGAKFWSTLSTPTPDFEYSPVRFSKKKCFPLEVYHLHPFEQVVNFLVSAAARGNQELVGAELERKKYLALICLVHLELVR